MSYYFELGQNIITSSYMVYWIIYKAFVDMAEYLYAIKANRLCLVSFFMIPTVLVVVQIHTEASNYETKFKYNIYQKQIKE